MINCLSIGFFLKKRKRIQRIRSQIYFTWKTLTTDIGKQKIFPSTINPFELPNAFEIDYVMFTD